MKKYKIKGLNGYIYVESFGGKDKAEWDRAKIYDENMAYIDYICLDGVSYKQYINELKTLSSAENFEQFTELLGIYSYDYSESLNYLLESMYDNGDTTQEEFDEIEKDLLNLTEKELIDKYYINRIGNYYFYINE